MTASRVYAALSWPALAISSDAVTVTDWTFFIVATASSFGGLAVLHIAWKRRNRPGLILSGWLLLLIAASLATLANGDRGMAQISVIAMCAVSVCLLAPALKGITSVHLPIRKSRSAGSTAENPLSRTIVSGLWTFTLSGPVAGLIAVFSSAALFRITRPEIGSPATAGISAIILSVLFWAVISTLLLIEPKTGRRSGYAVGGLILSAGLAFI